jgi:hypothetical protein
MEKDREEGDTRDKSQGDQSINLLDHPASLAGIGR